MNAECLFPTKCSSKNQIYQHLLEKSCIIFKTLRSSEPQPLLRGPQVLLEKSNLSTSLEKELHFFIRLPPKLLPVLGPLER